MKHILIACLVFALCLAVGLFSLFYVRASGEETVTLLERSIRQAEEEQYTAAAESLRQAKQLWEGRETVLGIFLHHEEVDEILALFAQLEAFIKLEDLDDYLAACGELTARLEHVRRMELPRVENVMSARPRAGTFLKKNAPLFSGAKRFIALREFCSARA